MVHTFQFRNDPVESNMVFLLHRISIVVWGVQNIIPRRYHVWRYPSPGTASPASNVVLALSLFEVNLGSFSISLLKLSQLKAKSLSQPSNLIQTRFLSCVQSSDLGEILTWHSNKVYFEVQSKRDFF